MNFARWEDSTPENISAWVASQPKDLPVHRCRGCPFYESIGRAAVRASAWDGPIVARCGVLEWQQAVSSEWRSPHRIGVDGDRRFVDYSDMIPASVRTLRLFADNRIPPGHCIVEMPDGRPLVRVEWS